MREISIDQATGNSDGNTLDRIAIRTMRSVAPIFSGFNYRGYSRFCKIIADSASPDTEAIVQVDHGTNFSFPFGDVYWIRMVSGALKYEPELERLFKIIRDEDFTLIDAGANFGYWSTRVTGGEFGSHPAIAIEPVPATFDRLKRNQELNDGRFIVERAALSDVSGQTVYLSGAGHASMSVGTSGAGQMAQTATIDDLAAKHNIKGPVVLKLDVEGQEIGALKGAERTLAGKSLIIYEDHGSDAKHQTSRHLLENGWNIFSIEEERPVQVSSLEQIAHIKTDPKYGYNFAATRGEWW